ncbi:MAG: glycosyltransferase family 92 protein [Chlamydiales bacterium]
MIFGIFYAGVAARAAEYKHQLAVCAIFQNEAPYLKEWIEYHKLLGVEHFYLYNNLSQDNYTTILKPYMKNGEVDLIEWNYPSEDIQEWNNIQCHAYNDALVKTRGTAKWVAFIDLDEFLVPTEKDNLIHFLKDYNEFAAVCINWMAYGTSWVTKIPDDQLLIETLTLRAPKEAERHRRVKSIVQPEVTTHCINPHFFFFKKGFFQVDAEKIAFNEASTSIPKCSAIRINHYFIRDEEWLINVKIPRYIKYFHNPEKYTEEWIQKVCRKANVVEDKAIFKYLPNLREKMHAANAIDAAPQKNHKFLLITGCARSGTTYISKVLSHSGLEIGHERLWKDGCASWPMAVNSDYSPYGPPSKGIQFEHIFHQVRDPLQTISSVFSIEPQASWQFICSMIPNISLADTKLMRAAKYWYYWNLAAERKAEWTYRVEDIEIVWDEMCQRLNISLNRDALATVSKTTNTRGPHQIECTWKMLRNELPLEFYLKIQLLAHRYGYPIDD